MNCPKCTDKMIRSQATTDGDEMYWYCRKCKKELSEIDFGKSSLLGQFHWVLISKKTGFMYINKRFVSFDEVEKWIKDDKTIKPMMTMC